MLAKSLHAYITCEHASNDIPREWRSLFEHREAQQALNSHRGWDLGSKELGKQLARKLRAPVQLAHASRLLIDLNRSPENQARFSEFVRDLPPNVLARLDARYSSPWRVSLIKVYTKAIRKHARLLHFSIHSFVPKLDGQVRDVDLGVLFDPDRAWEASVGERIISAWQATFPDLRVRANQPYAGIEDGAATWMRKHTEANLYAGIELEINQRLILEDPEAWRLLRKRIVLATKRATREIRSAL